MNRVLDSLSDIPDHRTRKGRRYRLDSIILLSLCAILSGADSLLAIHRFAKRLAPSSRAALGMTTGRIPAHASLHYIFKAMDSDALAQALYGRIPAVKADQICIDGKRLCGSRDGEARGLHILSAFAAGVQQEIGSLMVPPESAEMTEAVTLIQSLPVGTGHVISGDAVFTQHKVIEAIRQKGADYFVFVKGNQKELQDDIKQAIGLDSPLKATN